MDTKDKDQLASAKARAEQAEKDLKAAQKEADKALREAKDEAAMKNAQARAEAQEKAAAARKEIAAARAQTKENAETKEQEKTEAVENLKAKAAEKAEAKAGNKESSKDLTKAFAEYGQAVKDLQKAREKRDAAQKSFDTAKLDLQLTTKGRNEAEQTEGNAKDAKGAARWARARIDADKKFMHAKSTLEKAKEEFDVASNAEKTAKDEFTNAKTAQLAAAEKLNVATDAKAAAALDAQKKIQAADIARGLAETSDKREAEDMKKAAVQAQGKVSVDSRVSAAKKQIIKDNERVIKKMDAELKQQARKDHGAEFWRRGPLRKAEHQQERENQKKMLMDLKGKESDKVIPLLASFNRGELNILQNNIISAVKNGTNLSVPKQDTERGTEEMKMFVNHFENGSQRVANKLYEIAKTTNDSEDLKRKNEFLKGLRNLVVAKDLLLDKTGKGMEVLDLATKRSFAGEVGELVRNGIGKRNELSHVLIASEMCLKAESKGAAEARMSFLKEHFMDKSSIIGDYRVNSQNLQHIADKFESAPSFKKGGETINIGDMSTVERRDLAASLVGHYPTLYSALKEGHGVEMTNRQFISLAKDLNKELEKAGGLKAFEEKLLNDPDARKSLVGVLKENKVNEKDAKGKNTVDVGVINSCVSAVLPDTGASQDVNNPHAKGGFVAREAAKAADPQQKSR